MPKYVLGPREFSSKSAARAEFARILNAAPLGEPLRGDDAELVTLLISSGRHPEAAEKVGSGIAAVCVRPASFGTRCFWLLRTDGTEVDFSYRVALDGPPNPKTAVVWALREEIDPQILSFKREHSDALGRGLAVCGLCLGALTPGAVHVDHLSPTFDELATRFAESVGGWEALPVECVGATGRRLANRDHAEVWALFHRQVARLHLTHPRCNLSRPRGAR